MHTAYEALPVQDAELVPHMPRHDPLLHHMALLLQTAVEAEAVASRLYAEALANALAIHLLSRYAIGRHLEQPVHGSLTPSRLHRTIAYMLTHPGCKLSLVELAAVAQMSPAHLAILQGPPRRRLLGMSAAAHQRQSPDGVRCESPCGGTMGRLRLSREVAPGVHHACGLRVDPEENMLYNAYPLRMSLMP